jgi:hypothetical protein
MARNEVIARAQVDRRLPWTEYIEMTLLAHFLDAAQHKAPRSLSMLGIPAADVQQIDLHRLSRKGRTLVRSWVGPGGPGGPGPAGVREPRKPLPNPPHLKVALDLPAD